MGERVPPAGQRRERTWPVRSPPRGGGPALRQAGRGARRSSTRPGEGAQARAPASPPGHRLGRGRPRRALIQEPAPSPLPGPGAPARPGPPPAVPPSLPSFSSPRFPSPPPPPPLRCPGLRSVCSFQPPAAPLPDPGGSSPCLLPLGDSPPPPSHLRAAGPSGWDRRGDQSGVFAIPPPGSDGPPGRRPAAGCWGAPAAPRPGPF